MATKKIKRISSLRYNNIKLRKNIIYLPYEINDIEFYLKNLEFLNKNDLPLTKKFSVSVHPLKLKSKDHLILRDIIKKFINRSSVKNNSNISIILGETGSVASECLETMELFITLRIIILIFFHHIFGKILK